MTDSRRAALRTVLNPRSLAVIGASENPNKIGGRPLLYLSKFGFKGKVYPINPKRREAQGFKAYPGLADLPETPEVAIIAVPDDLAVQAVDECAARGVRAAIVMASGFGETSDPVAKDKERHMAERARATGMRIVGPNSQGLANFGSGAVLSFSTMFLETEARDGPVGVISQSGAMSVVPYGLLRGRGVGVRYACATGNDCDVSVAELASVVAEDPELKLLLLYLEEIRDPAPFVETARIARARGLPIVALKAGRTPAGQQAAQSHTGALANEDRVVEAFLERLGIWRARDVNELVDGAELYLKGWKPKGRRLVAISNSGASCVMAADAATEAGLAVPKLSDETRAGLSRILPGFATTTNPVDITAALLTNSSLFGQILPVIARDPAADAFCIAIPVAGQGYDVDTFAADAAVFARRTGKPVVTAIPQASIAAKFKAQGLPVFSTDAEAVRALARYLLHVELMQRVAGEPRASVPARRPVPATGRTLNEAESLELVGRHGVPVVEHRLCRTLDEAQAALAELGGPVAVKACSREVPHKSELGLVRLGVTSAEQVRSAHGDFDRTLRLAGARLEGLIVARMVKGVRELMIGAHLDPVFGPVVVVGDGGKYVEALPDVQVLLAPFTPDQVFRALHRLRIAPLLAGVRGDPPLDVDEFCNVAARVGALIATSEAGVVSLDLNPVIVRAPREGCEAVDALVVAVPPPG
ncbi:MAG TPA: acetate--CoA ligase family protein [Burkholderiales bacterium]|nr:acetate--CoA ligase family protein [Burkholderiales bacterium]